MNPYSFNFFEHFNHLCFVSRHEIYRIYHLLLFLRSEHRQFIHIVPKTEVNKFLNVLVKWIGLTLAYC